MTERLYYVDQRLVQFTASVVERLTWDGHPAVVLDRTAFYPASGGQPADRGRLSGETVVDVVVRDGDGEVVHVLARSIVDDAVLGEVDWPRRFDHTQQHTGQHILSALFERLLDADTVGFHLGADASTVDLNVVRLDPASAERVEELANRVVWEDRPVFVRFVGPDELAALPMRRPPPVDAPLRVVEIGRGVGETGESFDANLCGGTHVQRTGEIGLVKIVRLDYRGQQTRVEFLCGRRALHDYRAKSALTSQLAGMLTVGQGQAIQSVERLQAEAKRCQHDLGQAQRRLLEMEAAALVHSASTNGPYRVVWQVLEQRGGAELRSLALALAQYPDVVALLADVGERTQLCFARAEGLELDAATLLRRVLEQLGGKGGGQPHLAQGSASASGATQVRAVLSELASSLT